MATPIKPKNKKTKIASERQTTPVRMKREPSLARIPSRKQANRPRNIEALRVLREWDNFTPEEVEEQKLTWEFLKKALDEDRLSPDRPLFPATGDDS